MRRDKVKTTHPLVRQITRASGPFASPRARGPRMRSVRGGERGEGVRNERRDVLRGWHGAFGKNGFRVFRITVHERTEALEALG
jgi:hypothetical protein